MFPELISPLFVRWLFSAESLWAIHLPLALAGVLLFAERKQTPSWSPSLLAVAALSVPVGTWLSWWDAEGGYHIVNPLLFVLLLWAAKRKVSTGQAVLLAFVSSLAIDAAGTYFRFQEIYGHIQGWFMPIGGAAPLDLLLILPVLAGMTTLFGWHYPALKARWASR